MVDYANPYYPDFIVTAGISSTHYHAPKWERNENLGKDRLSTVCGRDSAVYFITLFPNLPQYVGDLKPCKICFRERE